VDGHDLGSFPRKPQQVAAVHRESPRYVPLIGAWQEPGWGAYAMPWIDGDLSVTLLAQGRPADGEFGWAPRRELAASLYLCGLLLLDSLLLPAAIGRFIDA